MEEVLCWDVNPGVEAMLGLFTTGFGSTEGALLFKQLRKQESTM